MGVPITEIYKELYDTEVPSAAQRQSVQHAVARLGDQVMRYRKAMTTVNAAISTKPITHGTVLARTRLRIRRV